MINTKKFIYDKLVAGLPNIPVFFQSDNENENRFPDKFPLITFCRLTANHYRTKQVDELFQITPWASTWLEVEDIKNSILGILQADDQKILKYKLNEGQDIMDPSTKSYWIPITFGFSLRNL